jgi:hypothetical protein
LITIERWTRQGDAFLRLAGAGVCLASIAIAEDAARVWLLSLIGGHSRS